MEENKLMDLLSTISRKAGGMEIKSKRPSTSVLQSKIVSASASTARPQLSQSNREASYYKNIISELQTMLDQNAVDMEKMRTEKDLEITELKRKLAVLVSIMIQNNNLLNNLIVMINAMSY